ncbi:MAG: hypothetical protein HY849_00360 [Nitrosomonadales bacterium]|nr:hypothetical protein [Nitrosomonadales bacterium]
MPCQRCLKDDPQEIHTCTPPSMYWAGLENEVKTLRHELASANAAAQMLADACEALKRQSSARLASGNGHATYQINIPSERMATMDTAIEIYLRINPEASVDDALDELFRLGVMFLIAKADAAGQKMHEGRAAA